MFIIIVFLSGSDKKNSNEVHLLLQCATTRYYRYR